MNWARILAYVTGTVDQELLARNEYLATENRILKAELTVRLIERIEEALETFRVQSRAARFSPLLAGSKRWSAYH